MKFSIYLNRHVFVMQRSRTGTVSRKATLRWWTRYQFLSIVYSSSGDCDEAGKGVDRTVCVVYVCVVGEGGAEGEGEETE